MFGGDELKSHLRSRLCPEVYRPSNPRTFSNYLRSLPIIRTFLSALVTALIHCTIDVYTGCRINEKDDSTIQILRFQSIPWYYVYRLRCCHRAFSGDFAGFDRRHIRVADDQAEAGLVVGLAVKCMWLHITVTTLRSNSAA